MPAINHQPKKKRIKLSPKEWYALKQRVWIKQNRRCLACNDYIPSMEHVHPHHIVTKGAGGHDIESNIAILDWKCHHKVGTAEIIITPEKEVSSWREKSIII